MMLSRLLPKQQALVFVAFLAVSLAGLLTVGQSHAAAVVCSQHDISISVSAVDGGGSAVPGVSVVESRVPGDATGCPNHNGKYVDDAPTHSGNSGTTGQSGNLTFYDNCYSPTPYFKITNVPAHYTLAQATFHTNLNGTNYSRNVQNPNVNTKFDAQFGVTGENDPNSDINYLWYYADGGSLLNATKNLQVDLVFNFTGGGPGGGNNNSKSWTLKSHSGVSPATLPDKGPGASTTNFTHSVTNQGPDNADFHWYVEGNYFASGSSTGTGWDNAHCGNNGTGEATIGNNKCSGGTLPSGTFTNTVIGDGPNQNIPYTFPSNAGPGDQYCQRISYDNANGPPPPGNGGLPGSSTPVCVKFTPATKTAVVTPATDCEPHVIDQNTTATCTSTIQNQGPDAATYDWWVQGSYNGSTYTENACSTTNNGIQNGACPLAHSPATVTNSPKGTYSPNPAVQYYRFPSTAQPNDQYCERIYASPPNGNYTTVQQPIQTSCITYHPTCTNCPNGQNCQNNQCQPCVQGCNGCNSGCPNPTRTPAESCYDFSWNSPNAEYGSYYENKPYYSLLDQRDEGRQSDLGYWGASNYVTIMSTGGSTSNVYSDYDGGGSPFPGGAGYGNYTNSANVNGGYVNWNYRPMGTGVSVEVYTMALANFTIPIYDNQGNFLYNDTHPDWVTVADNYYNYSCYSASCQITNVVSKAQDGRGIFEENQPYDVTVQITNTSPSYGQFGDNGYGDPYGYLPRTDGWLPNPEIPEMGTPTLQLSGGSNYNGYYGSTAPISGALPPGGSESVVLHLTAAAGAHPETVQFTPSYSGYGGFTLGSACNSSYYGSGCTGLGCQQIDVYQPFQISVNSFGKLYQSNENPTSFTYYTSVCNYDPNTGAPTPQEYLPITSTYTVNGATHASYPEYYTRTGNYYSGGPGGYCSGYTNNYYQFPYNSTDSSMAGGNFNAGDQYCSNISVGPGQGGQIYNNGWVGANGPTDLRFLQVSGLTSSNSCDTVVNKPYYKVFGAGISGTGGTLAGGSCTTTGSLVGWGNDNGGSPGVGTGTQLDSIATVAITGLASGQTSATPGSPPGTGLTFTNTNPGYTSGYADGNPYGDVPNMGGYIGPGKNYCTKTFAPTGPTTALPTNSVSGLLGNNQYLASSNLVLEGGQIAPSNNVAIYVNGDVYIDGNGAGGITLGGSSGGGWSWSPTSTTVPSFQLITNGGDIYIGSNVTQLDGLYVSQHSAATNKGGKIFTCANGIGSLPAASDIYSTCANQLVVHGGFIADQVDLDRAYGSLRNSRSNENPHGGGNSATPCSNGSGVSGYSAICAAELFDFSPELYLSNANSTTNSDGSSAIKYDSYTSLPPVL